SPPSSAPPRKIDTRALRRHPKRALTHFATHHPGQPPGDRERRPGTTPRQQSGDPSMPSTSLAALRAAVATAAGPTDGLTVDRQRTDLFAEATGDHQWIHVDTEKAAAGPFGTTIAHGYLTLSLLPALFAGLYAIPGTRMGVNYGLNKVRFPAPVPSGSRVR